MIKSKSILKYIALAFAFVFSIFIVGNANEVNAENITLHDGTISELTYNEFQVLARVGMEEKYRLIISKVDDNYIFNIIRSQGYSNTFYDCTQEVGTFTTGESYTKFACSNYFIGSTGEIKPSNYYFQINSSMPNRITYTDGVAYADPYEIYVEESSGYSEEEYLSYGKEQYNLGVESVDKTSDNQSAIDSYIEENNMKTEEEYLSYGESKRQEGIDLVDIKSNDEEVYQSGYDKGLEYNNFWTQIARFFKNIFNSIKDFFVNIFTINNFNKRYIYNA